jgi:hypothetical protein
MGEEAAPMAPASRRLSGLDEGRSHDRRIRLSSAETPIGSGRRQVLMRAQNKGPLSGDFCIRLILPNRFHQEVEEDRHEGVADKENDAVVHGVLLSYNRCLAR